MALSFFDRFQALGEVKFRKLLNRLMRGQPPAALAHEMQQKPPLGWGDFQNVSERHLTLHLIRLRKGMAEGLFGEEMAKKIAQGERPQIKYLEKISTGSLGRLEELSDVQRDRVFTLIEQEKETLTGYATTNDVVDGYRKLLLDIQKIRFEMGLDEYKGPVSGTLVRGASQTTAFSDGTSVQKQVYEAVSTIEKIFDARRIPHASND